MPLLLLFASSRGRCERIACYASWFAGRPLPRPLRLLVLRACFRHTSDNLVYTGELTSPRDDTAFERLVGSQSLLPQAS
eukprot:scaffold238724_cov31-Tisochrysis_lutea.AAC.4